MKKKKAHVSKSIPTKHENIPDMSDNIKTEEVEFDHLPSECDIIDIPIKREESSLEVKQYDTACKQSSAGVLSSTSLNEPSIDNNRMEKLNTNTTELSRQFDCQHCNPPFTYESLYIDHVNEVHRLESNNQQFYCQTCDITFMGLDIYHSHLRQVHKTKLQPLLRRPRSKPNRNIEPDPEDPDFYCKSCVTKHPTFGKFRKHIRDVNNIILQPLKNKPISSIVSDPEDPNFYCKSCATKHQSLGEFRRHIRKVHKMTLEPLRKRRKVDTLP